ncbi:MAG: CRISPR-associated protein Cas4 [candidate division KSB1 bacterium]|nr:CRISPR-associated protein Cas4 [candidate division KSB1 bacterium]
MTHRTESSPQFTGTQINYYFHCRRQLWLFSHHITCEQDSDLVRLGKLIHEESYEREHKEIEIDHLKLDFFDIREGVLHEVKKSDSFEQAHEWQVLFYLYFLKSKGIEGFKGEINYPRLRKCVEVVLTPEKEQQLIEILGDIQRIIRSPDAPPVQAISLCKKCSYFELCWID